MGVRKKHHYIPRFYLKRFSINSEGKCIALYNHKNNLFIQNAPIKHQACEEFLYGEDDFIENELSKLEYVVSTIFDIWTEEKILVPPPKGSYDFALLQRFIVYQIFRTIKQGNDVEEAMNQLLKAMLQVYSEKKEELEGYKIEFKDNVLLSLLHSVDKVYLLNFLDCRIIVNLSELPFITSDAPVVRYNQLMENIGLYMGATALAVKGLQIFFPIHPRLMFCMYDPQAYSCGENSINAVGTESIDDVHQLNILQYLNSDGQLFFDATIQKDYIEGIIEQCKTMRSEIGPISTLTPSNRKTYFYFTSSEDAKIGLSLTFFKILENAKDFEHEIAPLRHPSLERKKTAQ